MQILNELDFEKQIGVMEDRKLLEFIARQTMELSQRCPEHAKRIGILENRDRKSFGVSGGIGGVVAGIVVTLINYFYRGIEK